LLRTTLSEVEGSQADEISPRPLDSRLGLCAAGVPVLPAIPLDFEDAMSRILKAKPESKKPTKRKVAKKR